MHSACVVGLLAASLVGCSEDTCGARYRMGDSVPEAERGLVMAAAFQANAFLAEHGSEKRVVIDPSAQCTIEARYVGPHPDGSGPILGRRQRDEGVWLDLESMRNSKDVDGNDERYARLVVNLAIHEFLHAVGMDHHEGPGIMNSALNPNSAFTDEDLAACRADGVCAR